MQFGAQNPLFYGVTIKLIAWAVFHIGPHNPRDWEDWPVGASFKTLLIRLFARLLDTAYNVTTQLSAR
jgi:hypothetical protein